MAGNVVVVSVGERINERDIYITRYMRVIVERQSFGGTLNSNDFFGNSRRNPLYQFGLRWLLRECLSCQILSGLSN